MNYQSNERKAFIKSFSEHVRYAVDIQWDVDDEDLDELQLPEEVEIPEHIRNSDLDGIADYLSNMTGWLHNGFILKAKDTRLEAALKEYNETSQPSEAGGWRINSGGYDLYWELMYSKDKDWVNPDFRIENCADELSVTLNRIAEPEDISKIVKAVSKTYNQLFPYYFSEQKQKIPVTQIRPKKSPTKKAKTR